MKSECPKWEKFLGEVFEDQEQIEEFRLWVKRLLLGERNEQALVLLGPGRSGKTTLMFVIDALTDCTATMAPSDVFGRMSFVHELKDEKMVLLHGAQCLFDTRQSEVIKRLLSGDIITTRNKHESLEHSWTPKLSIVIEANHLPGDKSNHGGMYQRILLVKTQMVPLYSKDRGLLVSLVDEKEAIKAWAVRPEVTEK